MVPPRTRCGLWCIPRTCTVAKYTELYWTIPEDGASPHTRCGMWWTTLNYTGHTWRWFISPYQMWTVLNYTELYFPYLKMVPLPVPDVDRGELRLLHYKTCIGRSTSPAGNDCLDPYFGLSCVIPYFGKSRGAACFGIRERLKSSMLFKKGNSLQSGAGESESNLILFATSE